MNAAIATACIVYHPPPLRSITASEAERQSYVTDHQHAPLCSHGILEESQWPSLKVIPPCLSGNASAVHLFSLRNRWNARHSVHRSRKKHAFHFPASTGSSSALNHGKALQWPIERIHCPGNVSGAYVLQLDCPDKGSDFPVVLQIKPLQGGSSALLVSLPCTCRGSRQAFTVLPLSLFTILIKSGSSHCIYKNSIGINPSTGSPGTQKSTCLTTVRP